MDKKTQNIVLLCLLSALVVIGSIMLVYKPQKEEVDALKSTNDGLRTRLEELKEKESRKAELEAETEEFKKQFEEELKNYPADLNQETTVMFMKGTEADTKVINNNFSLPEDSIFYVLGQGASTDTGIETGNEAAVSADDYTVITEQLNVSYEGTYENLKKYLQYVADYKFRRNISQINIAYNQDEKTCSGTVTMNIYAITGGDRDPEQVNVSVKEGVDNIFTGGNGSSKNVASPFDADNGEKIVSDHEIMIMLASAANDSTSGIVVASDEADESTYVTSSENSRQELVISVTTENNKNYVTYQIGDKSYKSEIRSSSLTVYVSSSARVDSDDKNGVDVSVRNSTNLSVYFKVAKDDNSDPRFKLGSTMGNVKVY